jgi:erythromycin esterase-like protein
MELAQKLAPLTGSAGAYDPLVARASHAHYFEAELASQFHAVVHIDRTRALEPLELTSEWEAGELPENYAFAV